MKSIIHCRYAGDVSGRRRIVVIMVLRRYTMPLNILRGRGFMAHTMLRLNLVLAYYRRHCGGAGERCGENSRYFALIFYNELCKIVHPRLR